MDEKLVNFGPFRLDLERRELSRAGVAVELGDRALGVLCVLASARGEVVTKNELLRRVWPGLIVAEANIQVQVSSIRKALHEERSGDIFVATVSGRGYRLVGVRTPQSSGESTGSEASPEKVLPNRPSIAVLPFSNLSGDPQQDYFADGIVEEIITGLSRIRGLFVIARNSSFVFKGKAVDVKQVGRELGVRYILEGSVRKSANRVRITGQLIDAATGAHLWADRYDGGLEDIFDLQDQVTAKVIGAIAPKLESAEIKRTERKPTESLDAYDLYLRGLANVYQWTEQSIDAALDLFYKVIELDPDFTTAHGMTAWCYVWRQLNGWTIDVEEERAEIGRLVRRVAQSGIDDARALSFGGLALGYVVGDLYGGSALIDRALMLNPNLAAGWHSSGWVRAFLRETDVALDHLERAMRLSPLDPLMFSMQQVTALTHFIAGHYADAASWAERAYREQPNSLATVRLLAASHALCGRLDEARAAIAHGLRLDTNLRIATLKDRVGPYRPEDFVRYADALRLAGLPE